MSVKVAIYGLIDPRTEELRYVGKTNDPARRMSDYRNPLRGKSHNKNWLINLKEEDLEPKMIIIEEVDRAVWQEAEIFWIAYFRSIGSNLNNHREGGNGFDSGEVAHYNRTRVNKPSTIEKYRKRTAEKNAKTWRLTHPDGTVELVTDLQSRCRQLFSNPVSAGVELRKMRKTTGQGHYKGYRCIINSND